MGKHFGGFVDGRPVPGGATVSPAKGKSEPTRRVTFGGRSHGKSVLGAMVAALFKPGVIQRPAPMGDSEGKTLPDNEPGTIWTGPAVGLQNVANAETCPSCGSRDHRLCGVTMAEDATPPDPAIIEAALAYDPTPILLTPQERERLWREAPGIEAPDPFAPIEEPTASMTGLVGPAARALRLERAVAEARAAGLHYEPQDEARLQHDMDTMRIASKHEVTHAELVEALLGPLAVPPAMTDATVSKLRDPVTEFAKRHPGPLDGTRAERAARAEAQALNAAAPITFAEYDRPGVLRVRDATPEETAAMERRLIAHRVEPNNAEVICPACANQFRAIPVDVQRLLTDAGVEPPFIAHRVESERERRERLLAEWIAHREAAPMTPGHVPGEPMPRTEAELIEQAAMLAGEARAQDEATWALLFSMALTYCQQERRPFYEEHDGNRLVHSMVRSARGMGQ